jgi:hypothetical protein
MVKRQQMRWTPRGAHLLVQIRTRVLNDRLTADFHRWYPNLTRAPDTTRPRVLYPLTSAVVSRPLCPR